MLRPWTLGLIIFLAGSALFVLIGTSWERSSIVAMTDFKAVYYGSRSLIEHRDPYNPAELEQVYLADALHSSDRPEVRRAVSIYIYLPTAFVLTVPLGLLPWGAAHVLWMILTGGTLLLASYLMWSVASERAPVIAGLLLCFFLITSELLLEVGNAAGIVVSLCVIAVWCFLSDKFLPAGISCLALSLLVKPHDAGLVWLYFLLAGGIHRKRALQTMAVVALLALPVILWVSHVSPHWIGELNANLSAHSAPGADSDPGPRGVIAWTHGAQLISLQTVFSLFYDEPAFYNVASYLLCGILLIVWGMATLRSRSTPAGSWMALAAASALTMLPTYHRQQDTRLLLLTIPAFALLWSDRSAHLQLSQPVPARRSGIRWLALAVTAAGVFFTGDSSLQLLGLLARHLEASTATHSARLVTTLLLGRPAPLALLAVAIFYLWVYVRQRINEVKSASRQWKDVIGCGLILVNGAQSILQSSYRSGLRSPNPHSQKPE